MSKLYLEYIKRKSIDKDKYYLFLSGMFYIFLDEDAKKISQITPLNLTNLNSEIVKCGFPKNSLEKYLSIFNNLGIDVEIVSSIQDKNMGKIGDKVVRKIRNVNIDNLTPVKALNLIYELQGMINEE